MAKKTKGLSFDEKKQKLVRAMTVDASFYNFKEIELMAKKNGIVPQSVKEVLDCLIGDRLVTQEKIGSLNMYDIPRIISESIHIVTGRSLRMKLHASRIRSRKRLHPYVFCVCMWSTLD